MALKSSWSQCNPFIFESAVDEVLGNSSSEHDLGSIIAIVSNFLIIVIWQSKDFRRLVSLKLTWKCSSCCPDSTIPLKIQNENLTLLGLGS